MDTNNKKYGLKPEVLKGLKFTKRDKRLIDSTDKILIQGIVSTPPEEWNESQLYKAKAIKLNEMSSTEIRRWFDTEVSSD